MIKTERRAIDGQVYHITQYNTDLGLTLLGKLEVAFGKSIGMIMDAALKGRSGESEFVSVAGNVDLSLLLDSLLGKITPQELPGLAREILSTTQVEDQGMKRNLIFEADFAGAYKHLFKVLKEILLYQYSDFLADLVAAASGSPATKEQPEPTPRIKAKQAEAFN